MAALGGGTLSVKPHSAFSFVNGACKSCFFTISSVTVFVLHLAIERLFAETFIPCNLTQVQNNGHTEVSKPKQRLAKRT